MNDLAALPSNWLRLPLRRLLKSIEQGWSPQAANHTAAPNEWGVIKLSAVDSGYFRPDEHKALHPDTEPEARFEIRAGDVLLTRANTPELVGDACFVRTTRQQLMLCDLVYRLIPGPQVDPRFLVYWLLSDPGRAQITCDARGSSQSMIKISQSHIKSWLMDIPPLAQQRAIAKTLDLKVASIEDLLNKKTRLVALLEEKRETLITHAITKGLAPDAPMKESGVPSIGMMPAHWDTKRVKHLVNLITSGSRSWSEYFTDDGALFLQSGNIGRRMALDFGTIQHVSLPDRVEGKRTSLKLGDVLICITGALTGNVGLVREPLHEAYVNQHLALIRPYIERIAPSFLAYTLHGPPGQLQLFAEQYGLKQGLGLEGVANVWVPVPPPAEQLQIASYLDTELGRIEALLTALDSSVIRLREYRQSLITAAVTGKLDITLEAA